MAIDLWDRHTCTRCGYAAHDVIDDEPRYALLECVYCGFTIRVDPLGRERSTPEATKERLVSEATLFRFPSGRFSGKTLQEVDAEENGRRYIEFVKQSNPDWRSMIEAYLFQET
jgi:Zn ribbon nucleic-acid-binding protein